MTKVIKSSGNIYQDLKIDSPFDFKAKSDLALKILDIIQGRNLTQAEASIVIGAKQPDISKLKKGKLDGFTIDRLVQFLLKLDRKVEIRVTKPRESSQKGHLYTKAA